MKTKIWTVLIVMGLCASGPAFAADWPMPPTPLPAPLETHVQRFIDSTQTRDYQLTPRTYRALSAQGHRQRTQYRASNDSFYTIIGNGYWKYKATDLLTGGRSLSRVTRADDGSGGGELYLTPEMSYSKDNSGSGWPGHADGQFFLWDFDIDDRGYHYIAYSSFGWGLLEENGKFDLKWQSGAATGSAVCTADCPDSTMIVAARDGSNYYALVGGPGYWGIWNVNDPASPQFVRSMTIDRNVVRNTSGTMLGLTDPSGNSSNAWLVPTSQFVLGSTQGTSVPLSGQIVAATHDGEAFWFAPYGGGAFYKVIPASPSPVVTTYPIVGTTVPIGWIAAGADYVAAGADGAMRVYKINPTNAEQLSGEFTSFMDTHYTRSVGGIRNEHLLPIKHGGSTYFIWSAFSLGDVYKVKAGDSLSVARDTTASAGTVNPNAPNTSSNPFYGDLVTFKATFSGATVPSQIKWRFDSGMLFEPGQGLTDPATHRYTGSSTTPKTIRAEDVNRPTVFGQTNLTLQVPKARVKVPGTNELVETNKALGSILAGSSFFDASDGVAEGHESDWSITGGASASDQLPLSPFGVGDCGERTLSFTAKYGGYTPPSISLTYTVQPFVVSAAIGTVTLETVTFNNTTTMGSGFGDGAQWTETWELLDAVGTVLASQGGTPVTLGTKSPFSVSKSLIPSTGGKVRLTIEVGVDDLPSGCDGAAFQTDSIEIPLERPDPQIVTTSCQNPTTSAGSCTLSVKSAAGRSMTGWTYLWYIGSGSTVGTTHVSTSATYSPTFTSTGTYTVKVVATNPFGDGEHTVTLNVTTPPCAGAPPQGLISFNWGSLGGRSFAFSPQAYNYQFQECDTFSWNFGDGNTSTLKEPQHTYAQDGSYNVTLVVSNSNGSATASNTLTVGVVAPPPPPPPPPTTCADPRNNVFINFVGTQSGCGPGIGKPPCNVGETVQFSIDTKIGFSLASCHTQTWQFGAGASPASSSARNAATAFTSAGTRTVTLTVSNGSVSGQTTATVTAQTTTCGAAVPSGLGVDYAGLTSGCFPGSSIPCTQGEQFRIRLTTGSGYSLSGCETFAWNFGDGTTSTQKDPPNHTFPGVGPYNVSVTVTNTQGSGSGSRQIMFFDPSVPKPLVTVTPSSSKAKIGASIYFLGTAQSSQPLLAHEWRVYRTTGGNTLVRTVKNEGALTHTFNELGDFRVEYTATNAGGVSEPAVSYVTVALVQEYSFLIPVVAHLPGQGGTQWRTDLHIFNTDPLLGPIEFEYEFRGGAATITKAIVMTSSTQIHEDFLGELSKPFPALVDAGPVLVKARGDSPPQMWTRTYTVDATGNGTYGQFIPAVPLDGAAQSDGLTNTYILPGLEISERFRTNVGIVNPSASTVTVNVMARDHTPLGVPLGNFDVQVPPFALVQIGDLPQRIPAIKEHPFSLNIRPIGNTPIVVYGSMIDSRSNDPVFVTGVREVDQEGTDKRVQILPGAGRLEQANGIWRSDVVVYNADLLPIKFDVIYYDSSGTRVAEAKDQVLGNGAFIKVEDVLKWSKFDVDPGDSFGKIKVVTNVSANPVVRFPIVFQRTYKDRGELGSFGQGIPAISPDEANVTVGQAAYLAGVRADCAYYTNLGLIAIGEEPSNVKVTLLDDVTGLPVNHWQYTVDGEAAGIMPNASVIAPNIVRVISSVHDRGTLKIEVLSGGDVWAYASVIAAADPSRGCSLPEHTFDPEYIPAVKMPMP